MKPSRIFLVLSLLCTVSITSRCHAEDPPKPAPSTEGKTPAERKRVLEQYALRHAGDAGKGKALFQDTRTKCMACHTVEGTGGQVGVDLSRIGGKFDRPHLIESLLEPSRQIVEGYRTANVLTVDGRLLSGIMKQQTEQQVAIIDAAAEEHVIARNDIEEITFSATSTMPEGLANELSLKEFTDLIAYLESLRSGFQAKMGSGVAGPISIPDGFELQTVVTGLDGATALDVLPDGRVLVCEQPGRVRVIEDGKVLDEPVVTLPVDSYWERGVIGVTHDPEFPEQPYIYVCWVAKEPYPHHRVSRFSMKGDIADANSEELLLVGDDQTKMGGKVPAGHQGGGLHFGKDGKLYIGIGEQTAGAPSQRLDTFLGKMLRIHPDGSIPDDNPFFSEAKGKYRAIWARGCRNPFTFAIRTNDGLMLINDVGGESEEINVGRAGANYGWPVVEHGDMPEYQTDRFDGPIHWYKQSSLNGGDFCPRDGNWPEPWRGRYFFADFVQGWIRTLDPERPKDVSTFVEGIRRPVDLRFAPDGSLYVLLRNAWVIDDKFQGGTGALMRIRPTDRPATTALSRQRATEKSDSAVIFTENAIDESANNLPAFKIETSSATYFLEKSGGGLSSLVDRDGNDWLGFHPREGTGAGGEFRGFPNAVFQQGGNYFHARNAQTDTMNTRVERVEEGYVAILAESEDAQWKGRYEFFPTHCTFTMTQMPQDRKYWVLYEGTPGGRLDRDDWWMTSNVATPQPISRRHDGDIPAPEWIAFGDADGRRSIVLHADTDDEHPDSYYQMHEKMTVFGFGRQKLKAFYTTPGTRFSIGLVEDRTHAAISDFAKQMAMTVPVEKSVAAYTAGAPREERWLQPGAVYREYTIDNGGNLDWRVTDPNAKAEGAKKFLPNPVLKLDIRDLEHAVRAEAVLDRWGGHAGTRDKRIRFNENGWIKLPELATTPAGHAPERFHSQDNPIFDVPLSHLVKGENTIEGTVGPGNTTHWGQWGLYSLILRIYYDPTKKDFSDGSILSPSSGATLQESPEVELQSDANAERIEVLAWYDGYDEDGDGVYQNWHGSRFQPSRGQAAELRDHVGSIDPSVGESSLRWNTHLVPDQQPESIKLVARIHDGNGLIFISDVVDGLSLKRNGSSVRQYRASQVPEAFSVRVGQSKSCNIPIDSDAPLEHAVQAVLHYRTWEASDEHHKPFQINGHPHRNEGKNHHYDYDVLPVPVSELKRGDNVFTIQSDTEHHMLEVLWPGPAITVRYGTE